MTNMANTMKPDKSVGYTSRKPKYKSAILAAVHEGVSDLYESGLVDVTTMRHFDASCLLAPTKDTKDRSCII